MTVRVARYMAYGHLNLILWFSNYTVKSYDNIDVTTCNIVTSILSFECPVNRNRISWYYAVQICLQ